MTIVDIFFSSTQLHSVEWIVSDSTVMAKNLRNRTITNISASQSPRSFWSAPRMETSGRYQHRTPRFRDSLSNLVHLIGLKYHTSPLGMLKKAVPASGHDFWRSPKGSRPLWTRMDPTVLGSHCASSRRDKAPFYTTNLKWLIGASKSTY